MTQGVKKWQARWVYPASGPPLRDGLIAWQGRRILAVGGDIPGPPPRDLGNVALLPGLVNAHTHLEFSDLRQPVGQAGMPLPDWVRAVVERRRRAASQGDAEAARRQAVEDGLRESLSAGVTLLGEIATRPWSPAALEETPLNSVVFLELLGLGPEQSERLYQAALEHVAAADEVAWSAGLSPHAPYTVNPQLLARLCRLSAERHIPLAMHLAESSEELELLQSASGPLVEQLAQWDAWNPTAIPRGIAVVDYLRLLSGAHRAQVIHGNYLMADELQFVAEHRDTMSVVYCPRTHAYFGHATYPLETMVGLGIRVALGTDSRASNPDLDLFEEMRFVADRFPQLDPQRVLEMATIQSAWALGQDEQAGSLAPGRRADITVVQLPDRDGQQPYELLFDPQSRVRGVLCAGRYFDCLRGDNW